MPQFNFLLVTFLIPFFLRLGTGIILNLLNTSFLRRHGLTVPEPFHGTVDEEKLKKISAYTIDSANFGLTSTLVNQAFFLFIILSGFLSWLVGTIQQLQWGWLGSGLLFFAILGLLANLLRIPFNLYATFGLETRYGFNTKTWKVWLSDLFKGLGLSALLGGLLLTLLFFLIRRGGATWWVWAWVLGGGIELLMMWLYPVLIAPLFNKFAPVENKDLEQRIADLMARAGLKTRGIFRVDASKRSKHTNAYFTGLGQSKRIVLFDTLLQAHTEEEILAILAHEAGHWKKKHILKQLIFIEALSLAGLYVAAKLLNWPLLYKTFGLPEPFFYAGLLLIGALFSPLGYFFQPVEAAISRKFEREADDFSIRLMQTAAPMKSALKKLAADNLANLIPHPLYAWFYYSHPPLVERITRLMEP
jgi:STE24 endopeptidase